MAGGDGPAVIEPLRDQTVLTSETAKFTAVLKAGEPRAEISWSKAGRPLKPDNKKLRATFDDDTASLEIVNCEASDASEYGFVATNKVGKVSSQAALTVNGWFHFIISHMLNYGQMVSIDAAKRPIDVRVHTLPVFYQYCMR